MLYNVRLLKKQQAMQCLTCPYHDSKTNRCNGRDICCFALDETTNSVIEPLTNTPLAMDKIQEIHNNLLKGE